MWDKIRKLGEPYDSATLSTLDADGYPTSLRVVPIYDETQQTISFTLLAETDLQVGPASLLFHYHNEALWDLTNHVIRGTVEQNDNTWIFRPVKLVQGGSQKGSDVLKFMMQARKTAKSYLQKHNLKRPQVDWKSIKALRKQAE